MRDSLGQINPVNIKALPYRIQMLANKLGMLKTYQLLTRHGAELHSIPEVFTPKCALAANLGPEYAKVLIELWPGKPIDLPKVDKILRQWRDQELLADIHHRNVSVMTAVKKYDLTRQRINQILNEDVASKNYELPF